MARIDEQVETIVHDWKYSSEARPAIRDYLEYVSTYTFLAQTIIMEWVHQGRVGILVAASTPLSCRHYRAIKESGDRQGMTPDYYFFDVCFYAGQYDSSDKVSEILPRIIDHLDGCPHDTCMQLGFFGAVLGRAFYEGYSGPHLASDKDGFSGSHLLTYFSLHQLLGDLGVICWVYVIDGLSRRDYRCLDVYLQFVVGDRFSQCLDYLFCSDSDAALRILPRQGEWMDYAVKRRLGYGPPRAKL